MSKRSKYFRYNPGTSSGVSVYLEEKIEHRSIKSMHLYREKFRSLLWSILYI